MRKLLFGLFTAIFLLSATPALAASPSLSVVYQGSGNSYRITVSNADALASIALYRRQTTALWTVMNNFGQTDQSGYSSVVTNLASDGSNNPVEQYVTVNGQSSSVVAVYPPNAGCYGSNCGSYYNYSSYNAGNLTLSQTSLSLNVGQSAVVNISGGYPGYYSISNNSNSNVLAASISGSSLYLYANNSGNATITVCQTNSSANCVVFYGTVSGIANYGYYGYGSLSLSQTSAALSVNQSIVLTAYNSSGANLYLSANSNSNVVSATVSGQTLNLYGLYPGTATVTVCAATYNSQCASVYVTVSGYGYYGANYYYVPNYNYNYYTPGYVAGAVNYSVNAQGKYFKPDVSLSVGQTITVSLYPPYNTGKLYIPAFTNSNATISDFNNDTNTLTLYGQAAGSTTITFCPSNPNNCYDLTAVVSGGSTFGYNYNSSSVSPNVLGLATYNNGSLISENGTLYIVYKNTKTAFANQWVFTALGYNSGQVVNVGYSGLPNSGYVITATTSHPWGSWIRSGQAIYFASEQGLIPVPDYNIFTNNGGQDSLVVPANAYDFQRPILPAMVYNDGRLH